MSVVFRADLPGEVEETTGTRRTTPRSCGRRRSTARRRRSPPAPSSARRAAAGRPRRVDDRPRAAACCGSSPRRRSSSPSPGPAAAGPGPGAAGWRGSACEPTAQGRLRAVARARAGRHPGLRRRAPEPHAQRGQPPGRADPRHRPPLPPHARRARLRAHTTVASSRLRPSVLDLGFAYLSSMGLPEVALPHMEALVAALQESSSMSVLDGGDVIYVARVPTRRRIMTVSIAVGTRFPAHATSMGRVLLAHLGACGARRLPGDDAADPADVVDGARRGGAAARPGPCPRPGLRDRRPGARGGPPLGGRAGPGLGRRRSSPPSTCRCTPAGRASTTSRSASCHRCSTRWPGSPPISAR